MAKGTRKSSRIPKRTNKRRKGLGAIIVPWLHRFGMSTAMLAGILWLAAWFFMSDAHIKTKDWADNKTLQLTASMGFVVEDIFVEGRQYTDPDILRAIVNIQKGDPLFAFNPAEAQDLVEKISWVKSAHIERRWPNTLYIGLTERTPIALWQKNKRLRLLDEQGEVISTNIMEPFKDLIIVIGENAPALTPDLIANLKAEESLFPQIEAASFVSNRRWDLKLKNGMQIKLPEDDIGLAIRRIALAQENDNMLDKDLLSLDVRDPTRIIVRPRSGAVQEYSKGFHKASQNPQAQSGNNI